MTTFGSKVSARAIATDCCCPPENDPTGRSIPGSLAPRPVDHCLRVAPHPRPVDERHPEDPADGFPPEEDVRRHVLLPGERQVLVDHLDPHRAAGAGRQARDRAPLQSHVARVGGMDPGHDLHQSGLAGTVVAHDSQYLATAKREVDAVQHGHGAEPLCHGTHLQKAHVRPARLTWYWSMNTASTRTPPIAICW